jgi:hypothetical protein
LGLRIVRQRQLVVDYFQRTKLLATRQECSYNAKSVAVQTPTRQISFSHADIELQLCAVIVTTWEVATTTIENQF